MGINNHAISKRESERLIVVMKWGNVHGAKES